MQQINVDELKPHPRNNEFFDDMTGEKWEEFLESIKTRGVVEPIVITPDKVIFSGHQRVRACKELGIQTVMCDVHTYDNEDQILQDLIETNIRQRGKIDVSSKKEGRIFRELERIYGIQHGGNRGNQYTEAKPNNSALAKSQDNLAKSLDVSVDTLQNYKLLTEMIPELEELVDTGIVSVTTAIAIIKTMSPEQQLEMFSQMDVTKRITRRAVEEYKKTHPPVPSDYEQIKENLKISKKDIKDLNDRLQKAKEEALSLKERIAVLEDDSLPENFANKLKQSSIKFAGKVANFLEDIGGYVWLTDYLDQIPDFERQNYINSIEALKAWIGAMDFNINKEKGEMYYDEQ